MEIFLGLRYGQSGGGERETAIVSSVFAVLFSL
jgi:hypothetical protein